MIIYVDIDGVLCNNTSGIYSNAKPIQKNIEKVNQLYDEGNKIILWTARSKVVGEDWQKLTKKQMEEWGVKHHELSFNKPEYDVLIDDKARGVFDFKNNMAITNRDVTVEKVWGSELWMVNNSLYCGKILSLKKGFRCSLHSHHKKDETFYVISGKVRMEAGNNIRTMVAGDSVHILPMMKHRFTGIENSKIIEISTQHFEDDSYRLEESGKV